MEQLQQETAVSAPATIAVSSGQPEYRMLVLTRHLKLPGLVETMTDQAPEVARVMATLASYGDFQILGGIDGTPTPMLSATPGPSPTATKTFTARPLTNCEQDSDQNQDSDPGSFADTKQDANHYLYA